MGDWKTGIVFRKYLFENKNCVRKLTCVIMNTNIIQRSSILYTAQLPFERLNMIPMTVLVELLHSSTLILGEHDKSTICLIFRKTIHAAAAASNLLKAISHFLTLFIKGYQ